MHKIKIDNDLYQLPSKWDELSPKQLEYLVRLTQIDISVPQMKVHIMLYCLKARVCRHRTIYQDKVKLAIGTESQKVKFRLKRKRYMLQPEDVLALADLFDFLLRTIPDKYTKGKQNFVINPELTRNPYPVIRCRLRKFTGPEDYLYNITFEQFMYMQTYIDAMNRDPQNINYLIACFWHSGKEFDIKRLEKDAKVLHHLKDATKMVMYWYVLGCLSYLGDHFVRVFSGSGKQSGNVFDAQLRLLDSLAQSDMTKKPEVRRGLLYDALYSMDESVRKQEELEKERQNK